MNYLLPAVVIDLMLGDPEVIPHPVVLIGKLISFMETCLTNLVKSKLAEIIAGIAIVFSVVITTYFLTYSLIGFCFSINYYVGLIITIWLLASTISLKGLKDAAVKVYNYLDVGDIQQARKAVGEIVGRDTDNMSEEDVIRATVETVAENTSDGIIAPVLFYVIGGPQLAMAYKAVNTLDSMLGYNNDKYRYLGWAAARFDDVVNFIPARLTGAGFCLAAFILRKNWKRGWLIMLRDAGKHKSWNAGFPEAAAAGCLGIRLGGLNYYSGQPDFRAQLGDKTRKLVTADILDIIRLMYFNVFFIILLMYLFTYIYNKIM